MARKPRGNKGAVACLKTHPRAWLITVASRPCPSAISVRSLVDSGLPSRRRAVRLADLPSFDAVFVTNSHGVATVGRIDDLPLPVDMELMNTVKQLYESVPWDPI
jgi:hypothetical protein